MQKPTDQPLHASAPRAHGESRALVALLIAMTAIGPMALNILVPAVPSLAEAFQAEAGSVQLTISLYLVGLASSQIMLGPLSDRLGRRPVMLCGLAIGAVASLGAVFTTSVTTLIIARLLQAIGVSTGVVVSRAIIRDLYDRDRAASMLGWVTTAMVVAPMVSPLFGGILDTAFGWQSIFAFVSAATFAVLAWAALGLPETRVRSPGAEHQGSTGADLKALLTNSNFIGYVLVVTFGTSPYFLFLGGGPHVVITIMGHTSAAYGMWFALTSFGFMVGNFLSARLTVRFGVDRMVVFGVLFSIAGGVIMVAAVFFLPDGGPPTLFIPHFLMSIGNGILLPNSLAGAISVRPQAAGTASGLTGFTQMASGALMAQGIGYVVVASTTALPMATIMLFFALVTAVCYYALIRKAPSV